VKSRIVSVIAGREAPWKRFLVQCDVVDLNGTDSVAHAGNGIERLEIVEQKTESFIILDAIQHLAPFEVSRRNHPAINSACSFLKVNFERQLKCEEE